VENIYAAYNFSHFAIYLPNFMKVNGNLMEVLTNENAHFFGDGV